MTCWDDQCLIMNFQSCVGSLQERYEVDTRAIAGRTNAGVIFDLQIE